MFPPMWPRPTKPIEVASMVRTIPQQESRGIGAGSDSPASVAGVSGSRLAANADWIAAAGRMRELGGRGGWWAAGGGAAGLAGQGVEGHGRAAFGITSAP